MASYKIRPSALKGKFDVLANGQWIATVATQEEANEIVERQKMSRRK
jgi:hypothetical protein